MVFAFGFIIARKEISMLQLKAYRCDICHTTYLTLHDCEECEKSHANCIRFEPVFYAKEKFPSAIKCTVFDSKKQEQICKTFSNDDYDAIQTIECHNY